MKDETIQLIEKLSDELKPVRNLPRASFYFATFCLVGFATVVASVGLHGLGQPLKNYIDDDWFFVEMAIVIVGIGLAGRTAIAMATPGDIRPKSLKLNLWLGITILTLLLFHIGWMGATGQTIDLEQANGIRCVLGTMLFSIPPFILLTHILRSGYVVQRQLATKILVFASLLIGTIGVRFCCVTSAPLHVLLWHYLPVVILVPICAKYCARLIHS
jgi:hypothetical protein